jgi:hypothetical protein
VLPDARRDVPPDLDARARERRREAPHHQHLLLEPQEVRVRRRRRRRRARREVRVCQRQQRAACCAREALEAQRHAVRRHRGRPDRRAHEAVAVQDPRGARARPALLRGARARAAARGGEGEKEGVADRSAQLHGRLARLARREPDRPGRALKLLPQQQPPAHRLRLARRHRPPPTDSHRLRRRAQQPRELVPILRPLHLPRLPRPRPRPRASESGPPRVSRPASERNRPASELKRTWFSSASWNPRAARSSASSSARSARARRRIARVGQRKPATLAS